MLASFFNENFFFNVIAIDDQCDQMPRIFAQYLAIYNNLNLPKSTLNFLK